MDNPVVYNYLQGFLYRIRVETIKEILKLDEDSDLSELDESLRAQLEEPFAQWPAEDRGRINGRVENLMKYLRIQTRGKPKPFKKVRKRMRTESKVKNNSGERVLKPKKQRQPTHTEVDHVVLEG